MKTEAMKIEDNEMKINEEERRLLQTASLSHLKELLEKEWKPEEVSRDEMVGEEENREEITGEEVSREEAILPENIRVALWETVSLFQDETFTTSGRGKGEGKRPGVSFSYRIKISNRSGLPTDELLISRKEQSKTVTRSTVEMALAYGLKEQAAEGCVRGPKRLKVFGASYLYAMFLSWGLIRKEKGDPRQDP